MKSTTSSNHFQRNLLISVAAAAIVFVGGYFVAQSIAAGFFASVDASASQVSGSAKIVANTGAIGGQALQFNAAPTTPPPSTPSACPDFPAFPDGNCTGYAHTGVTLKPESAFADKISYAPDGNIVVSKAGTVIDGMDADNCIFVRADNVTIKRTRIRATCVEGSIAVNGPSGVVLEDIEIDGLRQSTGNSGISGAGFKCTRCNIYNVGSSIRAYGDVGIFDSYLHDNSYGGDSHNSGISMRGSNITAKHNTIRCDADWNCSGAFQIYAKDVETTHHIDNVLAENNQFYTSTGYCIAGGWFNSAGQVGTVSNIRILNNAFLATTRWPSSVCGDIGASAAWPTAQQCPTCQWTGNYQYPNMSKVVTP